MDIHDVAILPPRLVFPPHFLKTAVDVKASQPPLFIKLWLRVSKDMLL